MRTAILLLAAGASAFGATTTISSGQSLQLALNNAAPGDTILVNPGTYTTNEIFFHIDKAVTVQATGSPANTVIQGPAGGGVGLWVRASNVTVQGFSISNGAFGLEIAPNPGAGPISGVNVRNVVIHPQLIASNPGHGLYLSEASNVTVDICTIGPAYANGIFISNNSNSVTIANCTVQSTETQHGIAVQNSNGATLSHNTVGNAAGHGIVLDNSDGSVVDSNTVTAAVENGVFLDNTTANALVINNVVQQTTRQNGIALKSSNSNTISGNTVNSAGFDGVLLVGSSYNRIEKNYLTGFITDGIALSTETATGVHSVNNYIGKNTVLATGRAAGRTDGTGIWMDQASNGTYVFGNTESGAVEGGITSFNSSDELIRGNSVTGNGHAGVLIWNNDFERPNFPAPAFTVIHNNYIFNNPANGMVLVRGGQNNDIAYNFLSGTSGQEAGVVISSFSGSGGSTNNQVYLNIIRNIPSTMSYSSDTTATTVFQNRSLNSPNAYVYPPAGVKFDAGVYLGGNLWTGWTPNGNPSRGQPYTNFIVSAQGARGGGYADRFPFGSETLGKPYSVTVQWPVAGEVAAAGSLKTIAWKSKGCVLVDIWYNSAGTGLVSIASNYPDSGFYHWIVPAVPPAADYSIRVDCNASSGASTGVSGTSAAFTIGGGDVHLLSPGPEQMANAGSTLRIAWRKTAGVNAVNLFVRNDPAAGWTSIASNVTGDFFDYTLPNLNSNRVSIRVESAANSSHADSVDGYFTIRNGAASFTFPGAPGPADLLIGNVVDLEWVSPKNSYLVDLDLWDPTSQSFVAIVQNLPDYGKFTWFVPELYLTGGYVRATFRGSTGATISALNSGTVNLRYTSATGYLVPFYRLYYAPTNEHLYTTDANEYNVLGANGWHQEGLSGKILDGPRTIGGVTAVPYYRLYNNSLQNHFWTDSRLEYFTLRDSAPWAGEHLVGYVFDTPVAGTVPLYRLAYSFPPYYHHWTIDRNEYDTLGTQGWVKEGVAAYIFPANAPQFTSPAPIQISMEQYLGAMQAIADAQAAASMLPVLPAPSVTAVRNGASYLPGPVAPGMTVSIFGSGLGPAIPVVQNFDDRIGPELADTRVWFDGVASPVIVSSDGEVKAIVPYELAGKETARVAVEYHGRKSEAVDVQITPAAPALFTADQSGKGAAAIYPAGPAQRGSVISLYLTGEGKLDTEVPTGVIAAADRLPHPALPVAVQIGGIPADIVAAETAAGLAGVLRIDVRVPENAPAGAIPVTVSIGQVSSQAGVTLMLPEAPAQGK